MQRSEMNEQDIKVELRKVIDEATYIISGLENNDSFNKLIERWKRTNDSLNESWHLIFLQTPHKTNEAVITKMASLSLINSIDDLKAERQRASIELAKLENPDLFVNKDVDNG